jgi:hypothetical protein
LLDALLQEAKIAFATYNVGSSDEIKSEDYGWK